MVDIADNKHDIIVVIQYKQVNSNIFYAEILGTEDSMYCRNIFTQEWVITTKQYVLEKLCRVCGKRNPGGIKSRKYNCSSYRTDLEIFAIDRLLDDPTKHQHLFAITEKMLFIMFIKPNTKAEIFPLQCLTKSNGLSTLMMPVPSAKQSRTANT